MSLRAYDFTIKHKLVSEELAYITFLILLYHPPVIKQFTATQQTFELK